MKSKLLLAMVALASMMAAGASQASLLFNLNPVNGTSFRLADSGPGQDVTFAQNRTITNMGFDFATPNGADVKFLIYDVTDSAYVLSLTEVFGASSTPTWTESSAFSVTLLAGHTYDFGIIADNDLNVDYIFPPVPYSSDGMTAVDTGNGNYTSFASPVFADGTGSAEIGLELFGTAPEPATWLLLLGGVGAVGGMLRRARKTVGIQV